MDYYLPKRTQTQNGQKLKFVETIVEFNPIVSVDINT